MTDPKHLLDEHSDADEFERGVLRSGLDGDPSEAQQAEVWAGIAGLLAVPPLAASPLSAPAVKAAGGASKAVAVWLGVGKGFVVGLAIYGASVGVPEISARLLKQPQASVALAPAGRDPRSLSTIAPSIAPQASSVARAAEPIVAAATAREAFSVRAPDSVSGTPAAPAIRPQALPSVASFEGIEPSDSPADHASHLAGETRALRAARSELRAGRLADAFATLEASRRQFSAPELDQEREAVMIELLYRSGQSGAAAERASAFLRRFPESPHAPQIQKLTGR